MEGVATEHLHLLHVWHLSKVVLHHQVAVVAVVLCLKGHVILHHRKVVALHCFDRPVAVLDYWKAVVIVIIASLLHLNVVHIPAAIAVTIVVALLLHSLHIVKLLHSQLPLFESHTVIRIESIQHVVAAVRSGSVVTVVVSTTTSIVQRRTIQIASRNLVRVGRVRSSGRRAVTAAVHAAL